MGLLMATRLRIAVHRVCRYRYHEISACSRCQYGQKCVCRLVAWSGTASPVMVFIQGHSPAGVVSTVCSTTEARKRGIARTEVVRAEVVSTYVKKIFFFCTCSCTMSLISLCHNARCVQTLKHQISYVAVHLSTNRTTGCRKSE